VLGVIFDESITLRLHTEVGETEAFRTLIGIYFLFKRKRLSANIKLTLNKQLIISIMYACPAWDSGRYKNVAHAK
jgi:hypothetical protein